MTVHELIAAAKTKGPWHLDSKGRIRTIAEPAMCPITAIAGGRMHLAITTAVQELEMTAMDAFKVLVAADTTVTLLKKERKTKNIDLRRELERELLEVTTEPSTT